LGCLDGNSKNGAQKKLAIVHHYPDFLFAVYTAGRDEHWVLNILTGPK
jgi:hypothetical protein